MHWVPSRHDTGRVQRGTGATEPAHGRSQTRKFGSVRQSFVIGSLREATCADACCAVMGASDCLLLGAKSGNERDCIALSTAESLPNMPRRLVKFMLHEIITLTKCPAAAAHAHPVNLSARSQACDFVCSGEKRANYKATGAEDFLGCLT
jgi:hypothetical protein